MRSPSYTPHTQMASAPPGHTGVLVGLWPGGKSSCTACTGTTGPDSPCTGAHEGWPGGRYRVHRRHTYVPLSPPAGTPAGPGRGAVADRGVHLHAAVRAGSVAAAVET